MIVDQEEVVIVLVVGTGHELSNVPTVRRIDDVSFQVHQPQTIPNLDRRHTVCKGRCIGERERDGDPPIRSNVPPAPTTLDRGQPARER